MIGFLFGNFFGIAISSIAGQKAELDVVISAILLGLVELTSWWVYRRPARDDTGRKKLPMEVMNALKLGLTYSLFVEAFKLGS